jgi:hypothetical protein
MGYPVFYSGEVDVQPPLSAAHALMVEDVVNMRETDETRPIFAAIQAGSEPDLPGYGGQLVVSEDRSTLCPEEGESRHGLRLWLVLLLEHFFIPQGYVLNGEISWDSPDDAEDRGTVYIETNRLETTDVLFFDPGPSWNPNHYADDVLKAALQSLLESADVTGCTPDLTVVASEPLTKVRELMAKIP